MNQRIAELAKQPRGRRWGSRLVPYDANIRRMRKEQASYKTIAAWICDQGLTISASAVHAYVRARAKRGRCEYQLPATHFSGLATDHMDNQSPLDPLDYQMNGISNPSTVSEKEFIYRPRSEERNSLTDENLGFNDLLS